MRIVIFNNECNSIQSVLSINIATHGYRYLCDMNDGPIGRPDKQRAVVIDVYDRNDKVGGAPQRRTALVCSHHCQVEMFRGLKQAARTNQPCVWIQGERI